MCFETKWLFPNPIKTWKFVVSPIGFSLFDCFIKLTIFLITSSTGLVYIYRMELGWTGAPQEPHREGRCWSQSWSFQLLARAGAGLRGSYTGLTRFLGNIKFNWELRSDRCRPNFTILEVRWESDGAHVSRPHRHHGKVSKPPLSLQHPPLVQLKQSLRQIILLYNITKL